MYAPFETFIKINKSEKPKIAKKPTKQKNLKTKKSLNLSVPHFTFLLLG